MANLTQREETVITLLADGPPPPLKKANFHEHTAERVTKTEAQASKMIQWVQDIYQTLYLQSNNQVIMFEFNIKD